MFSAASCHFAAAVHTRRRQRARGNRGDRSLMSTTIVSPSWRRAIGPPRMASGATCPMTRPTEPPEKRPSVMSAIVIPFCRQRVVIRRRGVEHLRHAGRAARTFVADHDHVAVGEHVGRLGRAPDERGLAVEDARAADEDAVFQPTLDAGDLDHGAAVRARGCRAAIAGRRWACRVCRTECSTSWSGAAGASRSHLLGERLARARQAAAVEEAARRAAP